MRIEVLKNIHSANDAVAERNRSMLDEAHVFAVNIMASPGSGKTSLIMRIIASLREKLGIGVIEGDVASSIDAEKIDKLGIPVVQINTGGSCSLGAQMLTPALEKLPLAELDLVMVENVGNLICPAEQDLGQHLKLVIASIPEGDDKPAKYPLMFTVADVVIINKTDIAPYIDFNKDYFIKTVKGINPDVLIFEVSCKTGEGMDALCDWLLKKVRSGK